MLRRDLADWSASLKGRQTKRIQPFGHTVKATGTTETAERVEASKASEMAAGRSYKNVIW